MSISALDQISGIAGGFNRARVRGLPADSHIGQNFGHRQKNCTSTERHCTITCSIYSANWTCTPGSKQCVARNAPVCWSTAHIVTRILNHSVKYRSLISKDDLLPGPSSAPWSPLILSRDHRASRIAHPALSLFCVWSSCFLIAARGQLRWLFSHLSSLQAEAKRL